MGLDTFSEWLRRQGHRVVQTESSRWFDRGPRVYMAFPWHRLIRPSEDELKGLLRREGAVALRFTEPAASGQETASYDVVLEGESYDIRSVAKSGRGQIRRALERCEVQPISFDRYAQEGWLLEADTRDRQGRASRAGRETWERMVKAAADLDGFEVWGATVDGRLASAMMIAQVDDCAHILYQQSHREFLPLGVNAAFTFAVTKTLRQRPGVRMIHYGLQGLDAPASVDEFKFRIGYSRRPVRQRVVFHPLLAPLIGPASHAVLKRALRFTRSWILAKGEGLVRVCLEGKRIAEPPRSDAASVPAVDRREPLPPHAPGAHGRGV